MKTLAAIQLFIQSRESKRLSPRTIEWYQWHLHKFASALPELPTEPEPIEMFLATTVPDEKKDETRHGLYRAVKALYRFTWKRQRNPSLPNPIDFIDPPRRRKKVRPTLSSQEMLQLLSQASSLRDRAILSLFIDSGPRAGEAASLRKQNIFEDYIQVDGKSGERLIPISEETRRLLLTLVANNGKSDYVFQGQRGPLTYWGIYEAVKAHMTKAGISRPKLGPARMRHAFAKNFLANGGDLRSLQEILGHSNITTTQIYTNLAKNEIWAKHHQFTPLRSTHAAVQESLFAPRVVKEAEEILTKKGGEGDN